MAIDIKPEPTKVQPAAVFVTDSRAFDLTLFSATSLALSQQHPFSVHVFCHNFSPRDLPAVESFFSRTKHRLQFHDIGDENIAGLRARRHISRTAYLKLIAVSKVVGKHDITVYSDGDILFFDDLFIQTLDFAGHPVAAVRDIRQCGPLADPGFHESTQANNLSPMYFNSGLMIFDSKRWEQDAFLTDYILRVNEHQKACPYVPGCQTNDQCALNLVFQNRWLPLPLTYNMQSCAKFTSHWASARARHYDGPSKFLPLRPWRNDLRDVRYIQRIQKSLGMKVAAWHPFFSVILRLNMMRQQRRINLAERVVSDLG